MATKAVYPPETRSERVVVLMTPTEKRSIAARAREAGLSLGEYMRMTAEFETLSADEKMQIELLVSELRAVTDRTRATLDRLEATADRMIDEDTLRTKYRAELEASEVDWGALSRQLGLAR